MIFIAAYTNSQRHDINDDEVDVNDGNREYIFALPCCHILSCRFSKIMSNMVEKKKQIEAES